MRSYKSVLTRAVEILEPPHPFAGLRRHFYRAIAIDSPQRFQSYTALQVSNWDSRRDVEKHYETWSIERIAQLPLKDLAHPEGCHLWSWITGPNLHRARELIDAWGWRYSSQGFTWVKLRPGLKDTPLFFSERDFFVGLGLTTRHNPELCLLARRGNCRRLRKDIRELVIAPVREHSRKPDEVYRRIQLYCEGPFIELFARECRPNWDAWGNEVGKFDGGAA
jgi:N6-adenosine-specific RNA methylase IME4